MDVIFRTFFTPQDTAGTGASEAPSWSFLFFVFGRVSKRFADNPQVQALQEEQLTSRNSCSMLFATAAAPAAAEIIRLTFRAGRLKRYNYLNNPENVVNIQRARVCA